jgi:Na+/proline symporter
MLAAGIVSSWTHASKLLSSCTLSHTYGLGGGWWYGAVGTFQTLFFAATALKVKEKSNNAHTFPGKRTSSGHASLVESVYHFFYSYLEIVLQKHVKLAHNIYTFFGLLTNLINGSALAARGCTVFSSLTGMNICAAY